MLSVDYGTQRELTPEELGEFYRRLNHPVQALPEQIRRMMKNSAAFVTARSDGKLIGLARGVSDGVRGYLTECKLDPAYQGPAAVTRTDGRVEHDMHGIAREMAARVLERLFAEGVQRVDTVAYGTEVDFCEELGFKRNGGLVGVVLTADDWAAVAAKA
jgi:hypothetical protein